MFLPEQRLISQWKLLSHWEIHSPTNSQPSEVLLVYKSLVVENQSSNVFNCCFVFYFESKFLIKFFIDRREIQYKL